MNLKETIRTIPDYPKPGILFRDVTTLFARAEAFEEAVAGMAAPYEGRQIDLVAGIEARGFILGGAIATRLKAGFIPLRKKGKLPHRTLTESYALEYGDDELEMHEDAAPKGARVLLVDDLIATGGTAEAGVKLLKRSGAEIAGVVFLIELPELGGRERLEGQGVAMQSLLSFEGH
ncbi:adenine phosphoribosyltransferase [Euryhalocaulis caribicus]|uniref:adenine phosphoribosyltransferase n=1 Tax=Euryhalocaulis caribicus TaxID=1161401 RepID=UPI0003A7C6A6|nr:adenine phosphoribosyltransferase [Euryhalocaulis caribicus]